MRRRTNLHAPVRPWSRSLRAPVELRLACWHSPCLSLSSLHLLLIRRHPSHQYPTFTRSACLMCAIGWFRRRGRNLSRRAIPSHASWLGYETATPRSGNNLRRSPIYSGRARRTRLASSAAALSANGAAFEPVSAQAACAAITAGPLYSPPPNASRQASATRSTQYPTPH